MNATAVTLALAALLATGPPEDAKDPLEQAREYLNEENVAKLEAGESIVFREKWKDEQGKSRAKGSVLALVNAPSADVWACFMKHDEQPEYMPRLKRKEIYVTEGNTTGFSEMLKVFFTKVEFHILQTADEARGFLTFVLDQSKENDVKDTWGSWVFLPHGEDRCIIVYTVYVDSGRFVPKFIENYMMKRDLPDAVEALKKRVESGGTYTK